MTLAAQVSSAVGKTFECSLTSDVSWYLSESKYNEKGFKDNSQEWLGKMLLIGMIKFLVGQRKRCSHHLLF